MSKKNNYQLINQSANQNQSVLLQQIHTYTDIVYVK